MEFWGYGCVWVCGYGGVGSGGVVVWGSGGMRNDGLGLCSLVVFFNFAAMQGNDDLLTCWCEGNDDLLTCWCEGNDDLLIRSCEGDDDLLTC